ncbi:hypothetical protein LX32DRAFT_207583 [Colletotrichum zoysiae]|uniref:Uncharacterized protein n=1 Tax=Colletotrichum zoysiae TaxID=1216348 RepID=A0AAD9HNS9_9PEZI|nr:hypothetical protein LX32DRAFT_207583 [Colletotrichum zoysiae]
MAEGSSNATIVVGGDEETPDVCLSGFCLALSLFFSLSFFPIHLFLFTPPPASFFPRLFVPTFFLFFLLGLDRPRSVVEKQEVKQIRLAGGVCVGCAGCTAKVAEGGGFTYLLGFTVPGAGQREQISAASVRTIHKVQVSRQLVPREVARYTVI